VVQSSVLPFSDIWRTSPGPGPPKKGVQDWTRPDLKTVIIVDVGGKGGLLGSFAMSASLLATSASVVSLSLGGSISTCTAIGPALLLLLLGKLRVSGLALYSAKLVGLWALTATTSGTFLLKREHGHLDDSLWLQVLDLIW